jgi:midasin (ATPase involved in ribosome maturation)
MALVLSASPRVGDCLERLRRVRDWSRQEFPPEALLLIAPAVDGDGLLLAGKHREILAGVLKTLSSAFRNAGVEVKIV